jgi:anti-sigma factor RsiW
MDGHDRMLAAFVAGDLDPAEERRWDEHLLGCERCWRVVREDRAGREAAQLLRRPVPPGLADRVAFAVEMAVAGHPATRHWRGADGGVRWQWLAGAGMMAVGLAVTLLVVMLPSGRGTGNIPAAVAAVARYAQAVPPPGPRRARPAGPAVAVEVGRPVTVTAGGQKIVVRTWRLGGTEAVVATSGQPFPAPARAQRGSGGGMAWSARLGKLGLYCVNGRTSELVAAPVPVADLVTLAARLPPP